MPISRQVAFCLNAGINHVILRFNQRHKVLFEKFGLKVICPVFSPDLLERIISNKIISPKSGSVRFNKIISIGRTSPAHQYRKHVLNSIVRDQELRDQIVVTNASSSDEMYSLMSQYTYALNVSLNLDFNRRVIEMILAGCIPFSDRLEDCQLVSSFSVFRSSINWFDNVDHLLRILRDRNLIYDFYIQRLIDSQLMLYKLASSNYDLNLRAQLLESAQSSLSPSSQRLSSYKNEFIELFEYELRLKWSQNMNYDKIKSLSCFDESFNSLIKIISLR